MIAALALALAQDGAPDAPAGPSADDERVAEEVVVWGRLRVEQARDAVISDLEDLGYTRRIEKDGALVLRHDDPWRGEVWLHDDGWMRIKRQPVRVEAPETPWGGRNSAGSWVGCVLYPFLCVRPGGQVVGRRKFMGVETRTAAAVDPAVSQWSDRVADLAVDEKSRALPARLEALWHRGEPLQDGDPPLSTVDERKAALLAYWESRTDTPWGEAIREAVEAFVRAEVQSSDTPFTDAEIDAFNARSRAGRPLSLQRRIAEDDL